MAGSLVACSIALRCAPYCGDDPNVNWGGERGVANRSRWIGIISDPEHFAVGCLRDRRPVPKAPCRTEEAVREPSPNVAKPMLPTVVSSESSATPGTARQHLPGATHYLYALRLGYDLPATISIVNWLRGK